jgi:hypothetical protein
MSSLESSRHSCAFDFISVCFDEGLLDLHPRLSINIDTRLKDDLSD